MPEEIEATGQQHSADEGLTHHGSEELRGLDAVPRSRLHEGRFGRMFRALPPADQPRDALIALGTAMSERRRPIARNQDNARIASVYTYLGQFIDHDITFDPTSRLQRLNDPDALHNFRTPRYDLDSLYGSGPADSPFLFDSRDDVFRGVRLLIGRNPDENEAGDPLERDDLLRNRQERAVIGDPRNDENVIVSQLQLAFVRFHNRTARLLHDRNRRLKRAALFKAAARLVRWHYQWVVVRDFLPRIVGDQLAREVLKPDGTTELRFFEWQNQPFMPVEFSAAAYRFGHSMVRPSYDLNDNVLDVPIFGRVDRPGHFDHLGGFRALPVGWTIDWRRFVKIGNSRPQPSRKINTRLADPLLHLPLNIDLKRNSLAALNLLRGKALQLPSGQEVANAIGETPMTAAQLKLDRFGLSAAHRAALEAETPLWYYVLREAEMGGGQQLGRVGGRIVAEVLVGLLNGDPHSFLRQDPNWKPERIPAAQRRKFTLADLLKFATT
jgi:hypothetical protein